MKEMIVIGIKEAAQILRSHGMRITDADLRAGIEQRVYPFGDAVVVRTQPVFHIYKPKLMAWIDERSEEIREEVKLSNNYHTDNNSFVVYKEWEECIEALESDEEVGKLFRALFAYAKRGEETEFHGAMKMAYIVMKNAIERDGKKWEKTCEKRSQSGKMGGRPKKNPTEQAETPEDKYKIFINNI